MIRIGMIGVGGFGQVHLQSVRTLHHAGQCRLVAIADPTASRFPETLAAFDWEGVAVYDNFERMIARDDIDAVIIATPIYLHVQQTVAALAAGKHVYLEKPPCPTLAEYDQLEAAWKASGKTLVVGFQMQASPVFAFIKDLVSSGKIGDLEQVWAAGRWPRDDAYYSRASWAGQMMLGERPVFDGPATNALAHVVHASLAIAGMPTKVRGSLKHARDITSFDSAFIEAETEDNVNVRLCFSHAVRKEDGPKVCLRGTKGQASFDWNMKASVTVDGATRQYEFPYAGMVSVMLDFFAAVSGGKRPSTSLLDTLPFLYAVNGALKSGRGTTPFPVEFVTTYNTGTPKQTYLVEGLEAQISAFMADPSATPSLLSPGDWIPVGEIERGLYGV